MNSCESHQDAARLNNSPTNKGQHDYQQPPLPNLYKKSDEEGHFLAPQIPDNHRRLNPQCLRSSGPPPRPFKKARYAWEIKNYDYTLKKMKQNITQPENQSQNSEARVEVSQVQDEISNYNLNSGQAPVPNPIQEERMTEAPQMLGPPHHQGYNMGILSSTYQAHYGAVMEANLNHQNALSHEERLNTFHNQIPQDPDANLIRWHTRQLCRSIFDNTVNRMLENMGFSPVTERSQALHPLLVLSLSDDEDRDTEAHQRSIESQALSVALHQKGFLPPTYHYDTLESATTSDYDSSEEESELGEVVPEELSEQPNLDSSIQSNLEEDPYIQVSSPPPPPPNHPPTSPVHLDNNSSPQIPVSTVNQLPSETQDNNRSAKNLSNLKFDCDDSQSNLFSNRIDDKQERSDMSPKLGNKERTNRECIPRCKSRECSNEPLSNECSYEKKLKLDDNENCISSPKPETIIEGKVERVLDTCHTPALGLDTNDKNVNNNSSTNNNNNNSDSSYFIRNAIHLAIKQQGLGFQKA